MSDPDPLYDEENTMSDDFDTFDDMAERTIYPWIDDQGQEWDVEDPNYDDHNDFYSDEDSACYHPDANHELSTHSNDMELDDNEDEYDDSMDGDHDSGMTSAGWGTDEDYGYYGEDY